MAAMNMDRLCCVGAWQGIVLAATFAVSHNVREAKGLAPGTLVADTLGSGMARRDWGLQQVGAATWPSGVGLKKARVLGSDMARPDRACSSAMPEVGIAIWP